MEESLPDRECQGAQAASAKGMGTKLTDQDINDVIQRSSNYQDFAKKLLETHSVAAELDDPSRSVISTSAEACDKIHPRKS